jgi:CBS domain-containing protein
MHDVADFLKAHEPFSGLDAVELDRLAERAKVEFFAAGTVIFQQDEPPPEEIRVIRRGAVELDDDGRLLDLLEDGEMFGQAWMFSGLPTGWEARAREDTLCYAFAAGDVLPFLSGPAGLRFVARSLLMLPRPGRPAADAGEVDPTRQPVGLLAHGQPLVCSPASSLREAARGMVESGASSVLVRLGDGELGILTDHDLRSRVVARGLSLDTPVREVMSTPVFTARAEQSAAEVMLAMLDRGIRHVPVVSPSDEVVGLVTDADLLAAQARTPFVLRRAIANAGDVEELRAAAERLNPTVVSLHRGGLAAGQVSEIISVIVEALVRRSVELVAEEAGPPPRFAWLWLGSHGRREAVPSSDIDSGLVWEDGAGAAAADYMHGMAEQIAGLLAGCGFRSDAHGVTASGSVMTHAAGTWRETIHGWLDERTNESVMAVSILLDGRAANGGGDDFGVFATIRDARWQPRLQRLLLRLALATRPPTGFLHDIVVEHSGEHRGLLDIKQGGLLPIVGIARYAGLVAGAKSTSTLSRLQAGGAAGLLPDPEAKTLAEAFRLMAALRMEHQVRQLEEGREPNDYVDPKALDPLTRRHLREAFRLVASIQKRLATGLVWRE